MLGWTSEARGGHSRQGHAVAHSDPQICHRKPPLSPALRPSSIAYNNTGAFRVAGLKLHFGVGMGFGLPARAGYDASRHSQPPREGGRFPPAAEPKAPLEPCWQGAVPIAGPERGESTAERARASGSAIREARARSRASSRSECDAATERTCSGGVAGLPQTPQNAMCVSSPARLCQSRHRRIE